MMPRVLLELPLLVSDVRNLKEVYLSSPTGAKRTPYTCKYVESFDKAAIRHNTILHCEETVADSKTLNSTLVGYLSFPGSVETQRKRLIQLVYC